MLRGVVDEEVHNRLGHQVLDRLPHDVEVRADERADEGRLHLFAHREVGAAIRRGLFVLLSDIIVLLVLAMKQTHRLDMLPQALHVKRSIAPIPLARHQPRRQRRLRAEHIPARRHHTAVALQARRRNRPRAVPAKEVVKKRLARGVVPRAAERGARACMGVVRRGVPPVRVHALAAVRPRGGLAERGGAPARPVVHGGGDGARVAGEGAVDERAVVAGRVFVVPGAVDGDSGGWLKKLLVMWFG